MTVFLFILNAIIIPATLAEFSDWLPRLSQRILGRAAARLGDDALADRYSEEWAAELEEIPGKYSKLGYALGRLIHMRVILKEVRIDRAAARATPQVPAAEPPRESPAPIEPFIIPRRKLSRRDRELNKAVQLSFEEAERKRAFNGPDQKVAWRQQGQVTVSAHYNVTEHGASLVHGGLVENVTLSAED